MMVFEGDWGIDFQDSRDFLISQWMCSDAGSVCWAGHEYEDTPDSAQLEYVGESSHVRQSGVNVLTNGFEVVQSLESAAEEVVADRRIMCVKTRFRCLD